MMGARGLEHGEGAPVWAPPGNPVMRMLCNARFVELTRIVRWLEILPRDARDANAYRLTERGRARLKQMQQVRA